MKSDVAYLLAGLSLTLGPAAAAEWAAAEWKDALKENIGSSWKQTKVGMDRIRITEAGTVFVLQKDGIAGDLASDATFTKNTIEDGEIHGAKGVVAVLQNKRTNHLFKAGDKAYLWKVQMDGDELVLFLLSYDTYAANERGGRSTDMLPEDEAKAANTKTISLGQTNSEVEAALGKPDKIVNLDPKVTWIYKDLKVIFADGKVADVQ